MPTFVYAYKLTPPTVAERIVTIVELVDDINSQSLVDHTLVARIVQHAQHDLRNQFHESEYGVNWSAGDIEMVGADREIDRKRYTFKQVPMSDYLPLVKAKTPCCPGL